MLWWEGRAGGDAGGLNVAVYFPSVCACECDYRSLSQYLASADGIIAAEFIYSEPHYTSAADVAAPLPRATGQTVSVQSWDRKHQSRHSTFGGFGAVWGDALMDVMRGRMEGVQGEG